MGWLDDANRKMANNAIIFCQVSVQNMAWANLFASSYQQKKRHKLYSDLNVSKVCFYIYNTIVLNSFLAD